MSHIDIIAKITEYLSVGGLFNPELMEHDKVRDLLIECRNLLIDMTGWRPYEGFPAGYDQILVWAPDREEPDGTTRKPYSGSNIATMQRKGANGILLIGSHFAFDFPEPKLWLPYTRPTTKDIEINEENHEQA